MELIMIMLNENVYQQCKIDILTKEREETLMLYVAIVASVDIAAKSKEYRFICLFKKLKTDMFGINWLEEQR